MAALSDHKSSTMSRDCREPNASEEPKPSNRENTEQKNNKLLVIALDIEAHTCGYAVAFADDPPNILKISGRKDITLMTTRSCVLLDKTETLQAFGEDAVNRYKELKRKNKEHGSLLFTHFKCNFQDDATLKDINGNIFPAVHIFSMAIRYLKQLALSTDDLEITPETRIKYVLTYSAVEGTAAEVFMRKAAKQAEIDSKILLLVPAQKAIARLCLKTDEPPVTSERPFLVVDVRVEKTDIFVFEEKFDGSLKEACEPVSLPYEDNPEINNYINCLRNLNNPNRQSKNTPKGSAEQQDIQIEQIKTEEMMTDDFTEAKSNELTEKQDLFENTHRVTISDFFANKIFSIGTKMQKFVQREGMADIESVFVIGVLNNRDTLYTKFKETIEKVVIFQEKSELVVLKGAVLSGLLPQREVDGASAVRIKEIGGFEDVKHTKVLAEEDLPLLKNGEKKTAVTDVENDVSVNSSDTIYSRSSRPPTRKELSDCKAILDPLDGKNGPSLNIMEAEKEPWDREKLNRLLTKHYENESEESARDLKSEENRIKEFVSRKANINKEKIWLAYKHDKCENSGMKSGVIMIETNSEGTTFNFLNLKPCIYTAKDFSKEACKISDHCDQHKYDYSSKELIAVREYINNNAKELMKRHRFLSIVKPSPVRSKGFNSPDHTIKPEDCIALYVRKKGYIPATEKPFLKEYDKFKVDVREGAFYSCMQTDSENTGPLNMGFKISTIPPNSLFPDSYGTLGGFLEHPEYGTCGITSAHVLLDENEMAMLRDKCVLTRLDLKHRGISVCLCNDRKVHIGSFVKAVYTEGDVGSPGYEAAIFQIDDKFQTAGAFWNAAAKAEDKELRFDVGKVHSASRLGTSSRIIKFGATTGKTQGKFTAEIPSESIKLQLDQVSDIYVLKNQIEIKGNNNSIFSEGGDSGSLVMVEKATGETSCVGILVGVTSFNTTMVSPVGPILEKMNVSSLKCFQQEQLMNDVQILKGDVKEILETLQTLRRTNENRYCQII